MATVAPVIPPSVSPLPTPPSTTDPQNFDPRADAFLGSLPTNQAEMNSLGTNVYDNALKTYNSANDASAAANVAVPAADSANNSAITASTAYTNMQKLYLGAKTSAPSTDNQGNPLQLGTWYTNTSTGYWYWWDGLVWKLGMSDLSTVDFTTQVTGKPTTLPGYGITNQPQARTDLGLKSAAIADIVGVVSQSGGVPTGAIIQRGSNANGKFIRFADGTQICTNRWLLAVRNWTTNDSWIVGGWGYPANFIEPPVAMAINDSTWAGQFTTATEGVRSNQIDLISLRNSFGAARTAANTLQLLAIGRWF